MGSLGPSQDRGGALFWAPGGPALLQTIHLSYSFSATYSASAPVGDGLAFVAIQSLPPACSTGGRLCVLGKGIPGFGVLTRTYNAGVPEPVAPYVVVVDTRTFLFPQDGDGGAFPGEHGASDRPGERCRNVARETSTKQARHRPRAGTEMDITVMDGFVSVSVDGNSMLAQVALPSSVGLTGYWGFAAGSGGAQQRSVVRDVQMTLGASTCGD